MIATVLSLSCHSVRPFGDGIGHCPLSFSTTCGHCSTFHPLGISDYSSNSQEPTNICGTDWETTRGRSANIFGCHACVTSELLSRERRGHIRLRICGSIFRGGWFIPPSGRRFWVLGLRCGRDRGGVRFVYGWLARFHDARSVSALRFILT